MNRNVLIQELVPCLNFLRPKVKKMYIYSWNINFFPHMPAFFSSLVVCNILFTLKEKHLKKWVIIIVLAADRQSIHMIHTYYIYICIRKTPKNLANLAWLMYSKHCTVSATVRLNYITTMYYTTMYYYYPPDRKHVVNSLARLFKQYFSHPTQYYCYVAVPLQQIRVIFLVGMHYCMCIYLCQFVFSLFHEMNLK